MAQHIWHLAEHIYYSRPILSYINPIQNCSIHLESSIYSRVIDSKNSRTFVCHFLLYSEVSNSLTSDKPAMTKSTSYWKLNCFQLRYKLKLWIGQWSVHQNWKVQNFKPRACMENEYLQSALFCVMHCLSNARENCIIRRGIRCNAWFYQLSVSLIKTSHSTRLIFPMKTSLTNKLPYANKTILSALTFSTTSRVYSISLRENKATTVSWINKTRPKCNAMLCRNLISWTN